MNGSTHPCPLCLSTCCLGGSLKKDSAWATQWVCHCSALSVISSRDAIYRLHIQNYTRCTEQKNGIAKCFSLMRHFSFPRVFDDIQREETTFGGISQRVLCNWAGINPNSVYLCFRITVLHCPKYLSFRIQPSALNLYSKRHSEHCH